MKIHICPECNKSFKRKFSRDIHVRLRHQETSAFIPLRQINQCPFCDQGKQVFEKRSNLISHIDNAHLESLKYTLHKSALNGKIKFFRKRFFTEQSLPDFVSDKANHLDIVNVLKHELSKTPFIKAALILTAAYQIPDLSSPIDSNNKESNLDHKYQILAKDRDAFALRSKSIGYTVYESLRLLKARVKFQLQSLVAREEDLLMRGSGWTFESLTCCDIQITNLATIM